ncbi:hypothetical protein [Nocardia sp. NBC_01388]|uniref:hypothetical protein n=1 Tax=Nocardia sp. NBC_01388 TaxID=2903596 RepID=UPI003248203D
MTAREHFTVVSLGDHDLELRIQRLTAAVTANPRRRALGYIVVGPAVGMPTDHWW